MSTTDDINTAVDIGSATLAAISTALAVPALGAVAAELPAFIRMIEGLAAQNGTDEVTAARALLAQAKALDPGPLHSRADAADAAKRAELAAAVTRVSHADVSVLRSLATSPVLSDEERASLVRAANHTASTLGA